jgi:hypothetical protein
VRGLLSGFATLGVGAHYFGRDFITIDAGQTAHLSFEIDAQGHALLECILAAESHWWLPEELSARPPPPIGRGNPGPSQPEAFAALDATHLLNALGEGYAARFGVEAQVVAKPIESREVIVPDDRGRHWGPLITTALGTCSAGVRVTDGVVSSVALRGELIADTPGIALAETGLAMATTADEVVAALASAFQDESHALLGATLDELSSAVCEALERVEDLQRLRGKYQRLVELRAARDAAIALGQSGFGDVERPARRQQMKDLAREFPGALRELDDSTADQLAGRLAAVEATLESGERPRWMEATLLFHHALRSALALKSNESAGDDFWSGREALVRRPPTGRLLDLVWALVGERLGLSADDAERLVYPRS